MAGMGPGELFLELFSRAEQVAVLTDDSLKRIPPLEMRFSLYGMLEMLRNWKNACEAVCSVLFLVSWIRES